MKLDEHLLDALLARWPVARLATRTPDAEPHVLPVVFVAEAGQVSSPVDGKRKGASSLARVRNIEAHGRASLLLDHYDADWSQLWWVRLDGPAWIERGSGERMDRVGAQLRDKYPQYRDVVPFSGEPTLLVLRWSRVSAWSQAGSDAPIRRAAGMA
ncbi:MAG: TIGR03668 family PPOX class F420-dependent oxidoreductase [Pseudomonadales bacterium]